MSENCFNLKLVHRYFQESLTEEADVNLEKYLASYKELNKFFLSMGGLFGYVSDDLISKIEILAELIKDQSNFFTVKQMIEYEKENSLLTKSDYTSGSRTLLRLHRALDFIRLFLHNVSELNDDQGTGSVCRSAYNETLAHHHSFFIAAGAKLAMYSMPTKETLLKTVCNNDDTLIKSSLEVLPSTLNITSNVYDRIEKIYTENDLHNLP